MAQSMTGFGRAQRQDVAWAVAVEVRSVNHRFLKVQLRVPAHLAARESEIEALVRRQLRRGSVNLTVVSRALQPEPRGLIDEQLAAAYKAALARVGLSDATVPLLAGVVTSPEPRAAGEEEWRQVRESLEAALAELQTMRTAEGAALAGVVGGLFDRVDALRQTIETRAPVAVQEAQQRLQQRLAALLGGVEAQVDPTLLAREVAVLADRSDIREELDRLAGHLVQARQRLARGEDVGRGLDFLAQEMLRETSTIGAKCADTEISAGVVELKLAIEQIKEQVANLE